MLLEGMYQKVQEQQQEIQTMAVALVRNLCLKFIKELKFHEMGIREVGGLLNKDQLLTLIKSE